MININQTATAQARRNRVNRSIYKNAMQEFIRKQFDTAATSMEGESWITIAKEQGFNDIAEEMQNDLHVELLTA